MQVDGHLKADRERLHDTENNRWNQHLLKHIPQFLVNALLSWRGNSTISSKLADYVPSSIGGDQLAGVFSEFLNLCKKSPWVKTVEGWEVPEKVFRVNDYWLNWMEKYPNFRRKVEQHLGKKLMDPVWMSNSGWNHKWSTYKIEVLDDINISRIIACIKLPSELLRNEVNLFEFYQEVLSLIDSRKNSVSPEIIKNLLSAPIYPIFGGKFGSLQATSGKVFWISGRRRKKTGLEDILSILIIDPKYTCHVQPSNDSDEKKISEAAFYNERNEVLRRILKKMEIKELNEDTLLSDLQIPFLLENNLQGNLNEKYKVLLAIFESYQSKRTFDDIYLQLLGQLSDAVFPAFPEGENKLSDLLLPVELRIYTEDSLYADSGLKTLNLPSIWLDDEGGVKINRKSGYLEQLREFLLHCGICAGPRFNFYQTKYKSAYDFKYDDSIQFKIWADNIKGEYTAHNSVEVISCRLDDATRALLKSQSADMLAVGQSLYQSWLKTL